MPSHCVQQQIEAWQPLYREVTRQAANDSSYCTDDSAAPIRIVGDSIARCLLQYKRTDQSEMFTLTSKVADIGPYNLYVSSEFGSKMEAVLDTAKQNLQSHPGAIAVVLIAGANDLKQFMDQGKCSWPAYETWPDNEVHQCVPDYVSVLHESVESSVLSGVSLLTVTGVFRQRFWTKYNHSGHSVVMDDTISEGKIREDVQHRLNREIKACCERLALSFGAPERVKFFNVEVFNKFYGWFKTEEAFYTENIEQPDFVDGLHLFCDELDLTAKVKNARLMLAGKISRYLEKRLQH